MTQKLTPEVVVQLNDLPGFPARPNTTPPAPDRWVLGDWLVECHVHPEAANFASLPLVGNLVGDVRVSLADQAWYIWDGAAWQSMTGGGGGLPAPPLTSVQFNNGGAFGGSAGLTWNGSTLAVDGAVDRATAGTLTVGGTTATAITVGKVGVTTTFPGPVNLTGDVTTVGGTQFTTDAQFDGNVTFGNASTDNISFVGQVDTAITQEGIAAPAVSPAGTGRIYFDSGTNTFKASQNGGAYVDVINSAAPGGGLGDVQLNDGAGNFAGNTDLTFSGLVLSVTNQVNVTDGANTLTLTKDAVTTDAATLTLGSPTAAVNISTAFTLPTTDGANGEVLTTDGAGNVSWASAGGGGTITGSGTATQIAFFTGASAIGSETAVGSNSFTWDATNNRVGIGTNAPAYPVDIRAAYPQLALGTTAAGGAGAFRFRDGVGTLRADIGYAAAGSLLLQFTNNNSPVKVASTQNTAGNYVAIETGGPSGDVERVRFKVPADAAEVVFNDPGNAYNFRVESAGNANMLFVDGTNNRVGIGTNAPNAPLDVQTSIDDFKTVIAKNSSAGTSAVSVLDVQGNTANVAARLCAFSSGNTSTTFGLAQNNATAWLSGTATTRMIVATQGTTAPIEIGTASNTNSNRALLIGANAGPITVNPENSSTIDFVVESDTNANMLFVDASQNSVSIGTSGNTHTFNVGSGASANFCVASGGRIHTYDGSPPTNGQLLIGDGGAGNFAKASLTAGTGITITPGAGAITIAATGTTDVTGYVAQEALNAGDLVRFVDDAGTPKVQKADATNTDNRLNPVGFAVAAALAGAAVTVRVAGVADVPAARFDAAPGVANVGQRVFVSTTSGQITLTAPSATGDILQRVGVLVDGSGSPKVLVQVGDPTLL